MTQSFDVIIIGAGFVGSLVARFLSKYKLDILLIETGEFVKKEFLNFSFSIFVLRDIPKCQIRIKFNLDAHKR